MKVIKVTDLQELLKSNNNMVTAYECDKLPVIDLSVNSYEVEITYKAIVEGYSDDDAVEALEGMIMDGKIPYSYSCTTKIDD